MNLVGACLILGVVATLCLDVTERGIHDLQFGRPRDSNHTTDDRAAIAWLMQQRKPGDVLITTHHALPAIWWYGRVPISKEGGQEFSDGGGIFVCRALTTAQRVCRGRELETVIDPGHQGSGVLRFRRHHSGVRRSSAGTAVENLEQ